MTNTIATLVETESQQGIITRTPAGVKIEGTIPGFAEAVLGSDTHPEPMNATMMTCDSCSRRATPAMERASDGAG